MQKRRTFLSSAIVGFGTMSLADDILDFFREEQKVQKPLIIATWKNIKAVEAAWEVLKQGGSALNAVEAGARVPEADPLDTSVGYGGFPDCEGKVTPVSYTHLRAHETVLDLVCRLLLEKKKSSY